jgi:exonuclease VII large subunit
MAGSLAVRASRLTATAQRAVDRRQSRMEGVVTRLTHQTEVTLDRAGTAIERAELRLRAHDPAELLGRGWSITHTAGGALVRAADQVEPGTGLVTTTASGTIASTVDSVDGHDG